MCFNVDVVKKRLSKFREQFNSKAVKSQREQGVEIT